MLQLQYKNELVMKKLTRMEMKHVTGGRTGDECAAYENCNGVSGTVYCCSGAAKGQSGSCNCLHANGCTHVTNNSSNC